MAVARVSRCGAQEDMATVPVHGIGQEVPVLNEQAYDTYVSSLQSKFDEIDKEMLAVQILAVAAVGLALISFLFEGLTLPLSILIGALGASLVALERCCRINRLLEETEVFVGNGGYV